MTSIPVDEPRAPRFLQAVRNSAAVVWGARAELLTGMAAIGGWVFVTAGVADLVPARAAAVWHFSLGLFLLSLSGWRLLGVVGARGLYTLTRGENG